MTTQAEYEATLERKGLREPFRRYMVFASNTYYPSGGLGDLRGTFDTPGEAIECAQAEYSDDIEIFDRAEGVTLPFGEYEKP